MRSLFREKSSGKCHKSFRELQQAAHVLAVIWIHIFFLVVTRELDCCVKVISLPWSHSLISRWIIIGGARQINWSARVCFRNFSPIFKLNNNCRWSMTFPHYLLATPDDDDREKVRSKLSFYFVAAADDIKIMALVFSNQEYNAPKQSLKKSCIHI